MKYICRIGTNPSNDLVLNDRTASDFHAQLIMDRENKVFIRDLETRYGTRVNGNRVDKIELFAGDVVRIGFLNVDWEKTVNDWMLLNETQIEQKEALLSESENAQGQAQQSLSFRLASEAGKMRQEYFPGETGRHLNPQDAEIEEKTGLLDVKEEEAVPLVENKELTHSTEIEPDFVAIEKVEALESLVQIEQANSEEDHTTTESSAENNQSNLNLERVGVHVVPLTHVKSGNLNQPIQKEGNWLIQVLGILFAVILLVLTGWVFAWFTR